jgi:hypothetical protein
MPEANKFDILPTLRWLSFYALCWIVGVIMMYLIERDLAFLWVAIPAFALLNFAAYHATRVAPTREQFFLVMLIAMTTRLLLGDLVFWGSLITGVALLVCAAYRVMKGQREWFYFAMLIVLWVAEGVKHFWP